MKSHLRHHLSGALHRLRAAAGTLRDWAQRLRRAHLATLESTPVYETVLLAIVEVLGRRLDLQQLLTRLVTRLRRNPPELSDPDGWAY